MPTCCVPHCRNNPKTTNLRNNGISYHRFPKDPNVRKHWAEACGIRESSISSISVVCSVHFEESSFSVAYLRRILNNWAIPVKNLDSKFNTYIRRPRKRKCTRSDNPVNNDTQDLFVSCKIRKNEPFNDTHKFQVASVVENILVALKLKFKMQYEELNCLRHTNVTTKDFNNLINGPGDVIRFLPNLRSFALSLYYFSPRAYSFVRQNFNASLPPSGELKKLWYSYKGEPGFTKEAFVELGYISQTTAFSLLATLVIENMPLKTCIEIYDYKTEGYFDAGTGLEGDHLPEAKEVLVFLITAINSIFKIPVGYFFVNRISALQRAELVKQCIIKVHERGIKIVSLSCKGSSIDLAMAKYLGCSFKEKNVKFEHPTSNSPIIILWDLCHMIKLLFDSFKLYQTLLDEDGNKISWIYVQKVSEINGKNYKIYNTANNLGHYKYFKIEKMKLKLKTHFCTKVIAETIEYCRKDLKIEAFTGSKPTQRFLTVINNIVDVFTLKSLNNLGLRHALNEESVYKFIDQTACYIANLKTENGILLSRSFHNTGVLGVLGCLEALKHLLERLNPSKDDLMYLPIYQLSRKQLELFLHNIKTNCGTHSPTARQFKYAYKNLILKILREDGGIGRNRTVLKDVTLLNYTSAVVRINKTTVYGEINNSDTLKDDDSIKTERFIQCINDISEYNNEAFTYIVTYVTRYLIKNILCDECIEALTKNYKNIVYPSDDVVKICTIAELFFKVYEKRVEMKKNIVVKAMKHFIGTDIFNRIDYHQLGVFPTSNHVIDLMIAVVEEYIDIRLKMSNQYSLVSINI